MTFSDIVDTENMCPIEDEPYCAVEHIIVTIYRYVFLSWILYFYCNFIYNYFINAKVYDIFWLENEINVKNEARIQQNQKVIHLDDPDNAQTTIQFMKNDISSLNKSVKKLKKKFKKKMKKFRKKAHASINV